MAAPENRYLVEKIGGSTRTKESHDIFFAGILNDFRFDLNIQINAIGMLKKHHVVKYIEFKKETASKRTLMNYMSFIRNAWRVLRKDWLLNDPDLTNQALGIGGASRFGKHRAISMPVIEVRFKNMPENIVAVARLQIALGLRAQEAIQSIESLSHWLRTLRDFGYAHISKGTKGRLPRRMHFYNDERKQYAIKAIEEALVICKKMGGFLVPIKGLKSARAKYHREMFKAGFRGEEASHALRCTWAQDQFEDLLVEFDGDEAMALRVLSVELGHGDGRGRYCKNVYLLNKPLDGGGSSGVAEL